MTLRREKKKRASTFFVSKKKQRITTRDGLSQQRMARVLACAEGSPHPLAVTTSFANDPSGSSYEETSSSGAEEDLNNTARAVPLYVSLGNTATAAARRTESSRRKLSKRQPSAVPCTPARVNGESLSCWQSLLRVPGRAEALKCNSFFVLDGVNPLRLFLYNLVHHKAFECFILLVIVANCVLLAMDDPTTKEEPVYQRIVDIIFTSIFAVEMLLKMLAHGLILHRGAYLRDRWNVFDFIVVVLSFINFLPGVGNYTQLRAMRLLRPLRSANIIPGLRALVLAIGNAMTALVNVLFLTVFIFIIFGIFGCQLWLGTFRQHCVHNVTGVVHEHEFCRPGATGDENWGHRCPEFYVCHKVSNPDYGYTSFDNVLVAFLIVLRTATRDSWGRILEITYDVSGQICVVYFFLLVLVTGYFIPNLVLAVVNDKYAEAREKVRHENMLRSLTRVASISAPPPSTGPEHDVETCWGRFWLRLEPMRDAVARFCEGYSRSQLFTAMSSPRTHPAVEQALREIDEAPVTPFTYFISFCVLLNTVALASEHYKEPQWYRATLDIVYIVFTGIFGVEMLVRLFGIGVRGYVRDGFNLIDGAVTICSFVELALLGSNVVTAFRVLRLLRLLKLLRRVPSLQQVVRVSIAALPDVTYLYLIILLFLFIATVSGMQFFAATQRNVEDAANGVVVRSHFDSFLNSFYTVFQVLAGDAWTSIAYISMTTSTTWAILFFLVIVMIGRFVLLRFFLAIIFAVFADDDTK